MLSRTLIASCAISMALAIAGRAQVPTKVPTNAPAAVNSASAAEARWKYFRAGNSADSTATPRAGFALMGGGEQDPALKFLCERANGGDFLILRANTEDDYAQ